MYEYAFASSTMSWNGHTIWSFTLILGLCLFFSCLFLVKRVCVATAVWFLSIGIAFIIIYMENWLSWQVCCADVINAVREVNWVAAKIHSNTISRKSMMCMVLQPYRVPQAGAAKWSRVKARSKRMVWNYCLNNIHIPFINRIEWLSADIFIHLLLVWISCTRLRYANTAYVRSTRPIGLGGSLRAHRLQLQESLYVLLSRRPMQCGNENQ